ncbi:hypothetical protein EBR21_04640 [bacterium]|nr:hypothetical protein [bacterium]
MFFTAFAGETYFEHWWMKEQVAHPQFAKLVDPHADRKQRVDDSESELCRTLLALRMPSVELPGKGGSVQVVQQRDRLFLIQSLCGAGCAFVLALKQATRIRGNEFPTLAESKERAQRCQLACAI